VWARAGVAVCLEKDRTRMPSILTQHPKYAWQCGSSEDQRHLRTLTSVLKLKRGHSWWRRRLVHQRRSDRSVADRWGQGPCGRARERSVPVRLSTPVHSQPGQMVGFGHVLLFVLTKINRPGSFASGCRRCPKKNK
jgi:hypothetical protein